MTSKNIVKEELKNNNKVKTRENGILPQKEFKARNSLLTDLYEIDHFKSIRHCFVAVIIITFMNTLLCDILENGSVSYGFRYIIIGFGQFHKVIFIWLAMFGFTLSVFPVFCTWAKIRLYFSPKSLLLNLWDRFWLLTLLLYIATFLCVPPYIKGSDLPIASSAVVLAEQIRMLMKTHGFVRTNVPRITSYKQHAEKKIPLSTFSQYIYYLFVPTCVYRDEYPRTNCIRWSFVFVNFLEVASTIYFYSFLTANYLSDFKNFGLEPRNWRTITVSIFRMILPSSLIMLMGFYMVIHSWMNAWAEMLKFADRLFYLDWWNTSTYSAYYRKWNIVVHDYLHTYIYRDMYEIIVPGNKICAAIAVFITSAFVHEYIISFMLGIFFPVMFLEFVCFGMLLNFIKYKEKFIGNIFLWWSLSVGVGIQISLYTMEFNARLNCPIENQTVLDYIVPRMFYCYV